MEKSEDAGEELTPLEILRRRVATEEQQETEEERRRQAKEDLFNKEHEADIPALIEEIQHSLRAAALDLTEADSPYEFAQAQEIPLLERSTTPRFFWGHSLAHWLARTPKYRRVIAWPLFGTDLDGVFGFPLITIEGELVALPRSAVGQRHAGFVPVDLSANKYTALRVLKTEIVEHAEQVRRFNELRHPKE